MESYLQIALQMMLYLNLKPKGGLTRCLRACLNQHFCFNFYVASDNNDILPEYPTSRLETPKDALEQHTLVILL